MMGRWPLAMAIGACAAGLVGNSFGEEPGPLDTVFVMGQKENQTIERAPEAITALSADALIQNGVKNIDDINSLVPGLVVGVTEGYNQNVAIRGVGLGSPQDDGSPASVSFHQDGIFIQSPVALNTGFLDLDHIEVLRGPQGTVFGQNAIGGTINAITKKPSFGGYEGYADAEFGSFELRHFKAAVNAPLTSTFGVRLAGDIIDQKGFAIATHVPGDPSYPLSDTHNLHTRLSALLQPSESFSVIATVEYTHAAQNEAEAKNLIDPDPNPYHQTSDWPGKFDYDQTLTTAIATLDLQPFVLKSLSSLQYLDHIGSDSEGGLDIPLATLESGGENVNWFRHQVYAVTQEFDLSSKPGSPYDWVLGVFYLHSRNTGGYDQYLRNAQDPDAPNILDNQVESLVARQIADGTLYFETENAFRRTSVSGFGQVAHHFTDQLHATVGLRYTVDRNTTTLDNYFGDTGIGGGLIRLSQHHNRLTWRAELDEQATPHRLLYASISTGFKPGGGNPGTAPAVVPANYAPETITAFEAGSKSTLFENRLVANFAAFYYIDHNMQYHAEDLINFDGGVDNLPRVDIYGLEAEFSALLPAHWRLSGNITAEKGRIADHVSTIDNVAGNAANAAFATQYGYPAFIDAEFGIPNPDLPNAMQILNGLRAAAYRDVYGNAPPNLPTINVSLTFAHDWLFAKGSVLTGDIQGNYRDHYANAVFGDSPIYTTPSYLLMNLRFDYRFAQHRWDLSFAINNLADRAAVSYRFTNQYGGETTQSYFPPREYVAGVRYEF
jgi:iron complex outermembrane receptor protein